jgi:branched-chain amino acid transport system permease protein
MPELFHYMQQLVNGLTIGSTYALIAIGYTMVYGIIGMINFAHGEVYMIGSYVTFIVLAGLAMLGIHSLPVLMIAGFAAAILVTSAYGYSIERVAYRPLRNSNRLIPLISAIGMSIFLQNSVQLSQGSGNFAIPNLLPGSLTFGPGGAEEVQISYMQILVFLVTLAAMYGLTLFISRSRMGRACRACAEDMKMANLLGINTNAIIALTFVVGAALAASSGSRPSPQRCWAASAAFRAPCSAAWCWAWPKPSARISLVTSTRTSFRSVCWSWFYCSGRPASWAVRRLRKYEQVS